MSREYGLCLWTIGDCSIEEKCQIAKEIGVDGVEVEGDLSQDPLQLALTLQSFGLKPLSVTPKNVDISSENDQTRAAAVEYFIQLLAWAKSLGAKRICLHGRVGKTAGCGSEEMDWVYLIDSCRVIMNKAEQLGVDVVYEVLNRYESHQIVTAKEACRLVDEVGSPQLTLLLDAYHMNIEEANPVEAIRTAGARLGVYHIADSNRQAIGNGHANLRQQIKTLHELDYSGPIIMEMTAEGPDPFTPVKEGDYVQVISHYYRDSLLQLKEWDQE